MSRSTAPPRRLTATTAPSPKIRGWWSWISRLQNGARHASATKGTIYLRQDNTVDRILANGNVQLNPRIQGRRGSV